jgi:hypothetical protein
MKIARDRNGMFTCRKKNDKLISLEECRECPFYIPVRGEADIVECQWFEKSYTIGRKD